MSIVNTITYSNKRGERKMIYEKECNEKRGEN